MPKKFHLNVNTGVVSRCEATVRNCPLSAAAQELGVDNHFDSIGEARSGWEQMMKHKEHVVMSKKTPMDPKVLELQQVFDKQEAEWKAADKALRASVKADKGFKGSQEWYDAVQSRRKKLYAMLGTEQKLKEASPEMKAKLDAEHVAKIDKAVTNFENWKARQGDFYFHPEITSAHHAPVSQVITAFSGMSNGDVLRAVSEHVGNGMTEDQAYRKVWEDTPIRTDKRIVALDLETADPQYNGRIDNGPYSSIIEVGYSVREVDGTIRDGSFLCGVPDGLREARGTGAEEIHHISLDMVKDLTPFVDDPERQQEVSELLNGSVLLAHNAKFEVAQFTHSLPGFSEMIDKGQVEVLDTQQLCRFFVPEAVNNSNKGFVEAAGGEYVDAHRALPDAKMSLSTLLKLKNVD